MEAPLILYGHPISANSHKVRMVLSTLGLAWEDRVVDLLKREHHSDDFRKLNPLRQVPVLVDGESILRESHAICVYLCQAYGGERLWPAEPRAQAQVAQWLFFDATELHYGVGLARNAHTFGIGDGFDAAAARGKAALVFMDEQLQGTPWLCGEAATLADLVCYPFTALAGEAAIELQSLGGLLSWQERVRGLPGFREMPLITATRAPSAG